jgi:hypothetical protein
MSVADRATAAELTAAVAMRAKPTKVWVLVGVVRDQREEEGMFVEARRRKALLCAALAQWRGNGAHGGAADSSACPAAAAPWIPKRPTSAIKTHRPAQLGRGLVSVPGRGNLLSNNAATLHELLRYPVGQFLP